MTTSPRVHVVSKALSEGVILVGDDAEAHMGAGNALDAQTLRAIGAGSELSLMVILLDCAMRKDYATLNEFLELLKDPHYTPGQLFTENRGANLVCWDMKYHDSQKGGGRSATCINCSVPEIFALALGNVHPDLHGTNNPLTSTQNRILGRAIDVFAHRERACPISKRDVGGRHLQGFLLHATRWVHSSAAIEAIVDAGAEPLSVCFGLDHTTAQSPIDCASQSYNTAALGALVSRVSADRVSDMLLLVKPTSYNHYFGSGATAQAADGLIHALGRLQNVIGEMEATDFRMSLLAEVIEVAQSNDLALHQPSIKALLVSDPGIAAQMAKPVDDEGACSAWDWELAPRAKRLCASAIQAGCVPVLEAAKPLLSYLLDNVDGQVEAHPPFAGTVGAIGALALARNGKASDCTERFRHTFDFLLEQGFAPALTNRRERRPEALARVAEVMTKKGGPHLLERLQHLIQYGLLESLVADGTDLQKMMSAELADRWDAITRSAKAQAHAQGILTLPTIPTVGGM